MDTDSPTRRPTSPSPVRVRLLQTLLVASLLGAGAVHAADELEASKERRSDRSLLSDALDGTRASKAATEGDSTAKPYGSGYEARGLGAAKADSAAAASAAGRASAAPGAFGERTWMTRAGNQSSMGARRGGGTGRGGRR